MALSKNYNGNLKSWPLERYAKFVAITQVTASNQNQSQQGQWKQFSSQNDSLQISLLESNHMIVSGGGTVHESFSLYDAQKWLKLAVKGDSMLFLYKLNHDTRRFRIKFNKNGPQSALESCRQFVSKISRVIPVSEVSTAGDSDSQSQMEDSQPASTDSRAEKGSSTTCTTGDTKTRESDDGLTVSQLAKKVMAGPTSLSDKIYEHTNLPTGRLDLMIRLCLTDSHFPAFVTAVEQELLKVTSDRL